MKPLTMSEEQEAHDRDWTAAPHAECPDNWSDCNNAREGVRRAWAEVDALRAKLDTAQRALRISEPESGMWALERRLAASQTRERALREKGAQFWGYAACGCNEPDECVPCAFRALLLATPTDDSALRGLCRKVAAESWLEAYEAGFKCSAKVSRGVGTTIAVEAQPEWTEGLVTRVLGPERPSAAEPAGKEG